MAIRFPYFKYGSASVGESSGYQFLKCNESIDSETRDYIKYVFRQVGEFDQSTHGLSFYFSVPFRSANDYLIICVFDFNEKGYLNRVGSLTGNGVVVPMKFFNDNEFLPYQIASLLENAILNERITSGLNLILDSGNLIKTETAFEHKNRRLSKYDLKTIRESTINGDSIGFAMVEFNRQDIYTIEKELGSKLINNKAITTYSNVFTDEQFFDIFISPTVLKGIDINERLGNAKKKTQFTGNNRNKVKESNSKLQKPLMPSGGLNKNGPLKTYRRTILLVFLVIIGVLSIQYFSLKEKYNSIYKSHEEEKVSAIETYESLVEMRDNSNFLYLFLSSDLKDRKLKSDAANELYLELNSVPDIDCDLKKKLSNRYVILFPKGEYLLEVNDILNEASACIIERERLVENSLDKKVDHRNSNQVIKEVKEFLSNYKSSREDFDKVQLESLCCDGLNEIKSLKSRKELSEYLSILKECPGDLGATAKNIEKQVEFLSKNQSFKMKAISRLSRREISLERLIFGKEKDEFPIAVRISNQSKSSKEVIIFEDYGDEHTFFFSWSLGDIIFLEVLDGNGELIDDIKLKGIYSLKNIDEYSVKLDGISVDFILINFNAFDFKTDC